MKKTTLGVLFIVTLLVVSGIAMGQGTKTRYLIKSDNRALKAMYGVRHNFDKGFTTDLTEGQVKALEKFGIEVEEVGVAYLAGKPVCGDGKCQGNERETCPEDCSGGSGSRSCFPDNQMPYGIVMVNGGSGGAGINAAVLDTGVYTDHPDLDVKMCKDATKEGIIDGCRDQDGHGTHVSGTVAANGGEDGKGIYGVAPEANLWVIKVCGRKWCFFDDMAEGIRYAADQGANIISMSIGGPSSSLVKDAIDYAVGKGVLVVAAAGNDGPAYGSIDYPAAYVEVVAVGAIDSSENVPDWSSRGINDGDYIVELREVEFGAPGVAVESTFKDGCYAYYKGTSMATPHVSGLAAKLWQGNAADTRDYLHSIAKDIWDIGDDTATGFGLPIAP